MSLDSTEATEGDELTQKQRKAIASLERAFSACASNGLDVYGVDDTILVIPAGIINRTPITEIRPEKQRLIVHVDTCGAYVDSGGW